LRVAAIVAVLQLVHGGHATVPPPALPALPVIARVRVDVSKQRVLVVHEIVMARGEWAGGDVDLWVSFGPTLPRAFDAHLLAMTAGASAPDPNDQGEPIPMDQLARRPVRASPSMAGVVLHVREPALRRAVAASQIMAIRIRQVLPPPAAAEDDRHEIVVRLGIETGTPLTVRRVELSTPEQAGWLTRAWAQLCGPDADPYIIGFASAPPNIQKTPMPIDPAFATRRATDDLCIGYDATP
jgi:hypothetical protein